MLTGTILGLTSALCWSLANVTIHRSTRRFGPWGAMVWAQVAGGAAAVVAAFAIDGTPVLPRGAALGSLATAAGAALLAYGGLFLALGSGALSITAPIISAWSLVGVAVGFVFLDQDLSALAAIGVLLVLGGNVVLARTGRHDRTDLPRTPGWAITTAVLSAIGFGVMVPAVGRLGEEVGSLWAVPWVWGAELALGIPLLAVTGRLGRLPRAGDWGSILRPGLLEVAGFLAVTIGVMVAPLAVVAPSSSLSTALTVVWSFLLLGERLPRGAWIAAGAASLGVVLVNL